MRLKTSSLCALHFLTNAEHTACVHRIMGEGALLHEFLQLSPVECVSYHPRQSCTYFRLVTVADVFDQQLPKGSTRENDLAENVENLTAQCLPCFVQLFEQGQIDFALAGLFGDQVP